MDEFLTLKEICMKFKISDAKAQHFTKKMLKEGKKKDATKTMSRLSSSLIEGIDYIKTRRKEIKYNSGGTKKIMKACHNGSMHFEELSNYEDDDFKPVSLFPPKEVSKPYKIKEWGCLFGEYEKD